MAVTEPIEERRQPRDPTGIPRTRLVGWLLAAGLLVVLGVGIYAAVVRAPATLDPGTPEGVVQSYLQAVFDEDYSQAREYLAPALARRCTVADFRDSWVPPSMAASLDGTREVDDGVEVDVRLRQVQGPDPLGGGGYEQTETFELIDVDGLWRITGRPWPVDVCRW